MSFMDSRWVFWDNQTLTVAEESRSNGNLMDMEEDGATDDMLDRLFWNTKVGTAFAGLASGLVLELLTSDSATFASGVKCIAAIGSAAYPLAIADIVAGAEFSISVPTRVLHKYLEARFVPVSEAASAGKLDSWMGMEPLSPKKIQKEPT